MSTPATQLPFLPQSLPQTQADWQRAVNVLQTWAQALQATIPQTSAEVAAQVTPVNTQFPPGNVLRYGSNFQPGATDMTAAIAAAVASNDYVSVPSGIYRITSQINVNRGNITIEGANQNKTSAHVSQGGTLFVLDAAAGAGAACFSWDANNYQSVNVSRIGIQLNNPGLKQIGLRFGRALGARIEKCWIEGQGTTSDDTIGIQLDGNGAFTGDFVVSNCYIVNHKTGILCGTVPSPQITTVKIIECELYGTGGHPSSTGVMWGQSTATNNSLVVGGHIIGCTFDQWSVGIDSNGASLRQIANYFEACPTAGFRWTRGPGVGAVNSSSFGDHRNSVGAVIPFNGVDGCIAVIENNALFDKCALQAGLGLGLWGTNPPGSKPTVTGSKGGNAALTSLMAALSSYGLVTDNTT